MRQAAPVPPNVSDKWETVGSGEAVTLNLAPLGQYDNIYLVNGPSNGTIESQNGVYFTYRANGGITQTTSDSFTFGASNIYGSDTATVHLTIKDEEARVLALVNALASRARLVRMEINGATLEDVFLQLTGRELTP